MFSRYVKNFVLFTLCICVCMANSSVAQTVSAISNDNLPINVTNSEAKKNITAPEGGLISPSKAQKASNDTGTNVNKNSVNLGSQSSEAFNLKLKSIQNTKLKGNEDNATTSENNVGNAVATDDNEFVQYSVNPIENLGNSILSQMDGDLFSQMSEIEKSMTLLTLELRREKIRNEIEAQQAIRRKNKIDERSREEEEKLKQEERRAKVDEGLIKEKQILIDKERVLEVIRQRKLLNAYMNEMLMEKQEWLKEKELLYGRISAIEQEKKELIQKFKNKIDTVLEASAKNIQTAETAKVNFLRIVNGLKARNDQLRKRIEADAKIIKNAKNVYVKSPAIEELNEKNRSIAQAKDMSAKQLNNDDKNSDLENENSDDDNKKVSSEYAILGISGRDQYMSADVIDTKNQTLTLKIGTPLPTGHIVSEIGADYIKFTRNGLDDYLYIGRSIDGFEPNLGIVTLDK